MERKYYILLVIAFSIHGSSSFCQINKITKQENVVYGMISGMALLMDIYQPEKTNHRGIVYINGSAWGYGDIYQLPYNQQPLKDDYVLDSAYSGKWAQTLVQKGYTVFVINHRFIPAYHFPDIFYDCQRAVRFIRYHAKKYGIDPAHIGAMGHSSGANLVALLGVTDSVFVRPGSGIDSVSSKVQAVVTLAAPFNLADINSNADSAMARNFMLKVLLSYLGELPEDKNDTFVLTGRYAQASPISLVTKDDAAFLIYYSDDDPVIPFRQAPAMYHALKEKDLPSKLIMRTKESHYPTPDMEEVVKWFAQYLR